MTKLMHKEVARKGDKVTIRGSWRDRMRRPATVTLEMSPLPEPGPTTLVEGDAAEVFGAVSGIAEIAWQMGWRPRGLMGVVAGVVQSYKIPPESQA